MLGLELRRGLERFAEHRSGGEQLHPARAVGGRGAKAIHAAQHALVRLRRQRRLGEVLVHRRHVIEDVLLLDQHLAHAAIEDDGELAGGGRVVGAAVRHRRRHQVAAAVLVLQAFAAEGGAARGRADQKAPRRWSAAAQIRSPTRWKPNIE